MAGDPYATQDLTSSYGFGLQVEGKDWLFEDFNPTLLNAPIRTNHFVRCRACRNLGATVFGGFVVLRNDAPLAGSSNFAQFNGYCDTTAQDVLGVVDEYLPSSLGCLQYDICWIVMDGPTVVYTPLDGGADNVFTVGERVVALTAATSGATTAGRVAPQSLSAVTLVNADAAQIQNVIGRCMSAATTANTNAQILIYVGKW